MPNWFDDLSRVMASPLPRRQAMRLILGGVAGGLLARSPARALAAGADALRVATGRATHPDQPSCDVLLSTTCRIEPDGDRLCCLPNEECCNAGTFRAICCEKDKNEKCCEGVGAPVSRRCCNETTHACVVVNGVNRCIQRATLAVEAVDAAWIGVSVLGGELGLSSVRVLAADNATMDVPYFAPGAQRVELQAIKADPARGAELRVEACVPTGAGEHCTPSRVRLAELRVADGKGRARQGFAGIGTGDGFVRVQNGAPGVQQVEILVNGAQAAAFRIADDEVLGFDVTAGMKGEKNTVAVVASGRPGSSALVTMSRLLPGQLGAKGMTDLPRVDWRPASRREGLDLHWGN